MQMMIWLRERLAPSRAYRRSRRTFALIWIAAALGPLALGDCDPPSPSGGPAFLETFDGAPGTPAAWNEATWDVAQHTRARPAWLAPFPMDADHSGANCAGFPQTHRITTWAESVFLCNNHVMTAINPEGAAGSIYLTPDHLVDFSQGEASVQFDLSTKRTSFGDWIEVWVTPVEDQLQVPVSDMLGDLQGKPRRAVQIVMDYQHAASGDNAPEETCFKGAVVVNHQAQSLPRDCAWRYEDVLPAPGFSATRRDTFELRISRTRIRFCLAAINYSTANPGPNGQTSPEAVNRCWIDASIADLGWDRGVVQFGHHSNGPNKSPWDNQDGTRFTSPNTWHWDNVSIDPAVPFYQRQASPERADRAGVITLPEPAPAGAQIKLSAICGLDVDVGAGWVDAVAPPQGRHREEHITTYRHPLPAGVTEVQYRFHADGWYQVGNGCLIENPAVIAP